MWSNITKHFESTYAHLTNVHILSFKHNQQMRPYIPIQGRIQWVDPPRPHLAQDPLYASDEANKLAMQVAELQ